MFLEVWKKLHAAGDSLCTIHTVYVCRSDEAHQIPPAEISYGVR